MELVTERVILREFKEEDFNAVHAYASNIENIKYMLWGPNTEEDTKQYLMECMESVIERPRKKYEFAVTLKDSGKLIGGCGIYLNDSLDQGMLGWVLHMDYWKQGFMTEVGKELVQFAFNNLKLHRLYATCAAENYGSYKVMENLGMRREGHAIKNRKFTGHKDIWNDELFYGLLRDEWKKWAENNDKTYINVNERSFRIIKLLGKGKGGYSYLVTDEKNKYVIKQIHHEPCEYYNFGNKIESELNDYKKLFNIGIRMPKMIDVDIKNERILKEFIDGDSVFDLVVKENMKNSYINQMKEFCRNLYKNNINIDYFPTNFIVKDNLIWYVDYECNNYMEKWNFENWGIKYWSKTPEFIQYLKENSKKVKDARQ